jgi:hypothetical protein
MIELAQKYEELAKREQDRAVKPRVVGRTNKNSGRNLRRLSESRSSCSSRRLRKRPGERLRGKA